MNTRHAARAPDATEGGSFALVTYLPDPLSSFLTELRHVLPGDNRAEAHVTFLPPRPLTVSIDTALSEIARKLSRVKPFELELGQVSLFPETNILYLSVQTGHEILRTLHTSLNHGSLFAEENFDFVPHLTLGGPLASHEVTPVFEKAANLWSTASFSRRFEVSEAVLLWQAGGCSERSWSRVSSFPFIQT